MVLKNIAEEYNLKLTLIGGPEEKVDEILFWCREMDGEIKRKKNK